MPVIAGCSTLSGPSASCFLGRSGNGTRHSERALWPDTQAEAMAREAIEAAQREYAPWVRRGRLPPAYFLAVSGGGDNGAFGAGLLCGWHDSGTVPILKLATGVSTGSMIAPFAFLGGSYYDRLRTMYTPITPSDISRRRAIRRDLRRCAGRYDPVIPPDLALSGRADARRYCGCLPQGAVAADRLDKPRPAAPGHLEIGAIAASGRPGALELVRKILLASAAMPGAFPPVLIDVEAAGRQYQEMNVDGGASSDILYPPMFRAS